MLKMLKRARRRGERGSELIEFMIVFPLLLLVVSGIVDFGFMFQSFEVVTNAAREGARIAVLPSYTTADVKARVGEYIAASGLRRTATTTVTTRTVTLAGGKTISAYQVIVTYPHRFALLAPIARLFGGNFGQITLTGIAAMRVEVPST